MTDRRVTYCVVPATLGPVLLDLLREHFRERADVRVVVARRVDERRGAARRSTQGAEPAVERRQIQSPDGRRLEDRRSNSVTVSPLPLPAAARRFAERLEFVQRLEPTERQLEDVSTNRLVARFQSGDHGAVEAIYLRYFDRVYGYARAILNDTHEAEDVTQQTFMEAIRNLHRFEIRPGQPFRAWLFWTARNRVLDAVRRSGRLDLEPPATIQDRQELAGSGEDGARLDWISDAEIAMLVERLPLAQRQVLVMRFLVGMTTEETARALERSPSAVRVQQHRALRTLEGRIRGTRPTPARRPEREPMLVRIRPATVARGRRFALVGFGRPRAW